MKYAIIYQSVSGNKYLKGFTNHLIDTKDGDRGKTYCVELKELSTLFVPLVGDALVYL